MCSEVCASTFIYIYTSFLYGHINMTLPSYLRRGMFRNNTRTPWAVVPGIYGIHCKYNSLITLLVSNNTRLIHKWMYVCWDARTYTKTYESNEK